MKVRVHVVAILVFAALLAGCSGSADTNAPANVAPSVSSPAPAASPTSVVTPQSATAAGKKSACELLTADEIKSVQGEAPKETKADERTEGGFTVSQCYFALPKLVNSIVLTVTRSADGGADPRNFWENTFARAREGGKDRDKKDGNRDKDKKGSEREKGEEESPPQKVSGVGEEAFWTASRVGGALYALKGHSFIRISIGGADDQNTKLRKSTALARKVLQKL